MQTNRPLQSRPAGVTPDRHRRQPVVRRRLTINITPAERLGRLALGAAATIAGVILLTTAGSVLAVVLEVLLIAAGLDLVVTGALGHCPLYQRLGHVPASLRAPR